MVQSDTWSYLVELFLRFNRRLLFVVSDTEHELTVNESHLLMEIGRNPGIMPGELGEMVGIEKSIVSRTLAELAQRGLLRQHRSRKDARARTLMLTSKGQALVQRDTDARNKMARECLQPLIPEDEAELCNYLHRLADGVGAAPLSPAPEDASAKIAIRRLTRSMGFLSSNWFQTGYSVQVLQVLSRLAGSSEPLPLRVLRDELPYGETVTSRLVTRLVKFGFVRRLGSKRDLRSASLTLTNRGAEVYQQALATAGDAFAIALAPLTVAEVNRFIALLEGFLTPPEGSQRVELTGRTVAVPIEDDAVTGLFREFAMREILQRNLAQTAPATLLSANHLAVGLLVDAAPAGMLELIRRHGSWELALALLGTEAEKVPESSERLLSGVLRRLPRRAGRRPLLRVSKSTIGHHWVSKLLLENADRMAVRCVLEDS